MALSEWNRRKEEATTFSPRPNVMARVTGFAEGRVLLDVINTNEFYDGPSSLALDILDKQSNLTAETMADPNSMAFKKADRETGGIISIPSLNIRRDLASIQLGDQQYAAAETPRVFGVVNDTERQNRLVLFHAVWHKELEAAKEVKIGGESKKIPAQIRTFTSMPALAEGIDSLQSLESQIVKHCNSSPLPGRNTCGVTFRAFDEASKEVVTHVFLPPTVLHPGEEYRRPLEGQSALEHFKGQKFYRDFIAPFMEAYESGDLPGTQLETYPTVRSNAGAEEIKNSGLFNDDGSLNENGEKVQARFLTEDGVSQMAERGVMIFRKTEMDTIRPHIGVSYLSGYQRYAGSTDQVPSANYSGSGQIPRTLFQSKYGVNQSSLQENAIPESADDLLLEGLEQEMPDELHSAAFTNPESDFVAPKNVSPQPAPSPTETSKMEDVGEFNFEVDFGSEFGNDPDHSFDQSNEEELPHSMGMGR